MPSSQLREQIRRRLAGERGRILKEAPFTVALAYPSPYAAGMSSLGYQRIYRAIMGAPGLACERAFLDDGPDGSGSAPEYPVTYESLRPIDGFPIIAFSVAYELEIAGLVRMLEAARIPARRRDRDGRHPFVLAGGPLTFSNPTPLAGLVDAVIMGEAEQVTIDVLRVLDVTLDRHVQLETLARLRHVWVPEHHGARLAAIAAAPNELLPAWGAIRAPEAEFADMFLIETERGCSRSCTYCVMRRSTNGGMRLAPMQTVLSLVPADAQRVGLVGAAVSDHPQIVSIVNALADQGREVGLSSLRPDRLNDDFVAALKRAGYRTLTTAMDGTSERVREKLDRRANARHLQRCAELAKKHGMDRLKLYLMVGLPGETEADVDECATLTSELSRIVPVALGIAPFCPKRNTPLDGQPFAGIERVGVLLDRLRRQLKGRADVRSTSAKWAWVESVLAQGGEAEGLAVIDAVHDGGSFAAYRRAFAAMAEGVSAAARPKRKLAIASV